jgi:hypothetical protein
MKKNVIFWKLDIDIQLDLLLYCINIFQDVCVKQYC